MTTPRPSPSHASRQRHESGVVTVTVALWIVPLTILVALAVDLGAWFNDATKLQRAADAAALAAVVHMPDFDTAEAAARDAARRNGYVHGEGEVVVEVSDEGGVEILVQITAPSRTYFGQIITDEIRITRDAAAQYVQPVLMGNPTSVIGTADLDTGVDTPSNYWLNANSSTWTVANGDLLNAMYSNPYYDDTGYVYAVNKPAGVAVEIQSADSGQCKRSRWSSFSERFTYWVPHVDFDLYAADDTPRNFRDNLVAENKMGTTWFADHSTNANYLSQGPYCPTWNVDGTWGDPNWITMFTIPAGAPEGQYYLTAGTRPGSSYYNNKYGLRVRSANMANGGYCSTLDLSTVTYGECPTINAVNRMAIFIGDHRPDPADQAGVAAFYFATIGEEHAGNTLKIELWDPGEGSQDLQFLDPHGNAMPFRYRVDDRWGNQYQNWTDVDGPCAFDATRNHCMPAAHNDRMVTIEVDIAKPDGGEYTCNNGNCWWKVRYESTNDVHDATTWAVEVVGSPIRLSQ